MRQFWTVIACLTLATLVLAQEDLLPSLGVVLDLERPSEADVLLLRNGDQLTGTILNESFSIRTSYAQLSFNNRAIAGIDLEGGASNIESIVTVNDNRFSGFIDDPVFAFRLQGGSVIEVRREKVLKAIFRLREQEREGIPQRQFVTMKNGDYFSGLLLNTDLVAATTYADVPLDLASVESITFIGEFNPLTRVLYHNGDTLQGILNQEDMRFLLDVGGEIEIYQDRIDSVFLREGFVPRAPTDSTHAPSEVTQFATSAPDIAVSGRMFSDERVRMAVAHSVDWKRIGWTPMLTYGQIELDVRDVPFDPNRATQLMAEAGFPAGLELHLMITADALATSEPLVKTVLDFLNAVDIVFPHEQQVVHSSLVDMALTGALDDTAIWIY